MNNGLVKSIIKFLGVSGIGFGIDVTVYSVLVYWSDINVGLANYISAIPAITFVYIVSTRAIFKTNSSKLNLKHKYIIYLLYQLTLVTLISYLNFKLHYALTRIDLISFMGEHLKLLSKAMITPITMTLNYIVMRYLLERV